MSYFFLLLRAFFLIKMVFKRPVFCGNRRLCLYKMPTGMAGYIENNFTFAVNICL